MPTRTKSIDRCERCEIHRPYCFCSALKPIQTKMHLTVLMHTRERRLTTNTARLALAILPHSKLVWRGLVHDPVDAQDCIKEGFQSLFLFPYEHAEPLSVDILDSISLPINLIVPDGSWRQAAKFGKRITGLQSPRNNVRWVKLPPGPPSQYFLRKEPTPESVCTFEAIARAIGILESAGIQKEMEKIFQLKVQRTLQTRGQKIIGVSD